jgi:phospholipase/lecithinase/hemolysin
VASTLQNLLDMVAPITVDTLSQPSTISFLGTDLVQAIVNAKPVNVAATPGAPFDTIYAFGDSLSDVGNISFVTRGIVPVSPPYAGGVFSNGPNWLQDLAVTMGLPVPQASLGGGTDFAYGGAQTGQTPIHAANPTDLPSQINQFTTQVAAPLPNALYAIWAGSNDVLTIANNTTLTPEQQQAVVGTAVNNEVASIQALIARGATDFAVLNVPDIGKTPNEQTHNPASATALAALYDSELATAIEGLQASGAVKIDLVDTFTVLNVAIANPSAFGFTDVTTPAWTGNLVSSSSGTLNPTAATHLFFDGLHPTAMAHALLATQVNQTLAVTFA